MGGPGSGRKPTGKLTTADKRRVTAYVKALEDRLDARDKAARVNADQFLRLSYDDQRAWALRALAIEATRIGNGTTQAGRVCAIREIVALLGFQPTVQAPSASVIDLTDDATPAQLAAQLDSLCEG